MDYDLAIIGAGWAGFSAARKAKELGLKTALIEAREIGGTCLNRGCIPTKALLYSAKIYKQIKKASEFGVKVAPPEIDFSLIQSRKEKIIQELRQGMNLGIKGIDFYNSQAEITSNTSLKLEGKKIETKNILFATGSVPTELPFLKFDGKKILSSDSLLQIEKLPGSLLIIGGGVIGCEFASLFNALGVGVTIVEKMPQLLPGEDNEVAKKLQVLFKKRRIEVNTGVDASGLNPNDYELILVCVGRRANTKDLGLESQGIKLDKGKISTDEYLRTSVENIYAAGDCTAKIMLAHFAAYQGKVAVGNIADPDNLKKADNAVVPNCIFTDPEIASVGRLEAAGGVQVKAKKFDFLASGMARIIGESEGFIKVVYEQESQDLLGASIIGPRATELISVLSLAVSAGLKISQIRETIFAHPTLSESIHEAVS